MNRQTFVENGGIKTDEYNRVKELCDKYKQDNHITESLDIHHLRDTEEQRRFNDTYYERWGVELDGTFELGKYVVFITHNEHARYHFIHNNPMFNPETRDKVSKSREGMKFSDEHKQHLSDAHKGKPRIGWTDETVKKCSEANKKTWSNPELRKALSDARKGQNNPMYGRIPKSAKKVLQLDLNGIVICEYQSIKAAATHFGVTTNVINKVCHGLKQLSTNYTLTFA